jgi:translation initiation factor IF-2
MANRRIHELASEWGVKSRDILDHLGKVGITGKKAQSSLTDADAGRVYEAMNLAARAVEDRPVVTRRKVAVRRPGEGTAAGYDEITETRVKRGVLLRRKKRTQVGAGGATEEPVTLLRLPDARISAPTAVDLTPEALTSFAAGTFAYASRAFGSAAIAEPLPTDLTPGAAVGAHASAASAARLAAASASAAEEESELAWVDEADELAEEMLRLATQAEEAVAVAAATEAAEQAKQAEVTEPEEAPVEVEAAADAPATDDAEPDVGAASDAAAESVPEAEEAPVSRVLGRIDLSKQAKPVLPATAKDAKEGKDGEEAKPGEPGQEDKAGRRKKRKVVRKEDMFDAMERSFQSRSRRPMKRRVAPGQRVGKTEVTVPKAIKRVVRINDVSTAGELAKGMGVKAGEVLGVLMRLGVMKSINDPLDFDTVSLVAEEFDYRVENTAVNVAELLAVAGAEQSEELESKPRAPVVTIMGHVDHGKTSLLDVIRKSNVVEGEAGGITQHIGAYTVNTPHGEICFLDTPGHAAFTAMRARGAKVTDLVVLVTAADDGVMPQTLEAVNHAKAAELPVVVAVNKIDKPDANPDRVKQQLSERGVQPEDWGGDTQFVPVSAMTKEGVPELLEAINLAAQMLELSAPDDGPARGTVIESRLDKGRGPVATVLIQQGCLERGDYFVVGATTGRVRAMTDHTARQLSSAGPSQAVEIIGLDGVPEAGDAFDVVEDLGRAQQVAEHRHDTLKKADVAASVRMSLEDLQRQVAAGDISELKVVIKADVHGSAEALKQALEKLTNSEVALNVIHLGVGAINESDVQLAMASKAIVIGFHVRPEGKARKLAEQEGVDIRLHTIIYEVLDEVTAALEGLLAPDFKEVAEGRAEVRDTFSVPGGVTIAGCYLTEGKITRSSQCRLLRDNVVVHTGTIGSLRRFKDDVREVQSGYECGIGIERYNDIKPGDVIESYRLDAVKRTLGDAKTEEPQPEATT